jgi:hypothetical protein
VVEEKKGEARFVEENYGASKLAERLGVKRYPAVFVDDVLVATPKDFGFYGPGEGGGTGRYAPIRNAASQERFRADLSRALDLILAGKKATARAARHRDRRLSRRHLHHPRRPEDRPPRPRRPRRPRRALGHLVPALPRHPRLARRPQKTVRRPPHRRHHRRRLRRRRRPQSSV